MRKGSENMKIVIEEGTGKTITVTLDCDGIHLYNLLLRGNAAIIRKLAGYDLEKSLKMGKDYGEFLIRQLESDHTVADFTQID